MYAGPIVRTYSSMGQYRADAAQMATQGYHAVNVEPIGETNGCLLTFLLITGLLLTPVCIGLLILLCIPFAFSKRYNVSYIFQPTYSQPFIPPSYSRPLPPQAYSQPLTPSPYSQPFAQPGASDPYSAMMSPAHDYQAPPPQLEEQFASLGARFREGIASVQRLWAQLTPAQRAIAVAAIVVVGGAVVVAAALVLGALMSGGATPA